MENAQLTPQKYTHLPLHLRKCSCFSRHDRLCRICVKTGHHIQASQTKHLERVNGPSWVSQFLFLCRLIRRGRRRHRLCIISQVRFVGLTFRNAAFEERTLRHFEHNLVMISSILSSFKTSCKITCQLLILKISRNKRQIYVISWAREIILVGFFFFRVSVLWSSKFTSKSTVIHHCHYTDGFNYHRSEATYH